jgi:hypothetical protein
MGFDDRILVEWDNSLVTYAKYPFAYEEHLLEGRGYADINNTKNSTQKERCEWRRGKKCLKEQPSGTRGPSIAFVR